MTDDARMRIAMVTEVWAPTVNGVVTRLAATVADLLSRGHQVLVICPAVTGTATAPNQLPEGLAVRTVPTVSVPFVYGGQAWGWPAPRVTRYLREFAPDVVHVANPISLGVAGVRAAGHLHRPLVCSYHTDVASYARHYHLGWLRPVIRRHLRQLHAHAALNLVTSAAGRDQLETIVGPGPESVRPPVALWPRGVDLSRFSPACRTPGGASHHVLYVGRLADEKGIATLATLAADPGFHLTVVGDGPARHTLERQLPSGTRFTGTLGGTELADAYRAADLFAFPSVTDTLGLVLLEAMASGLPVLAADSPASRELLGRSPAARLWQPGQEGELPRLAHELLATGTPDQLAARARAEVSGRDWHAATAALLDHYERVAALIPAAGSTPRATSRPTGRRFWSRPAPG